ncbi:MAG TPA: GAF domain-containing protein [Solirubrobacteraceae bacterium]|nr:GAF domain-containing protein [Solirubrobacteraceae bacterium]
MEGAGTVRANSDYDELLDKLESAQEAEVVELALVAAREHLGMDASYITTIDAQIQTIHALVSDPETVNRYQGTVFPVEQTYCMRMLGGEIPSAVPDTRQEPAISELPVTQEFHAYVGVPVTLSDGSVHGTLCCVSKETRPGLGPDEVRFMQVLADIVGARVDRVHGDIARLTERFKR